MTNESKWYLSRVRLNNGGYTDTGEYFGIGKPLYRYWNDENAHYQYVRAWTREEAKFHIRQIHPDARFWKE